VEGAMFQDPKKSAKKDFSFCTEASLRVKQHALLGRVIGSVAQW
jgi:hypothetical protein